MRGALDKPTGGKSFSRGALYTLLKNTVYIGKVAHRANVYEGQHQAILNPALWQRVQEQLAANRHKRTNRFESKAPSLLAGLLFDDNGNAMSPSHATKNGKRYRYYISQAIPQFREQEVGSVTRIPAQTIEDLVTDQIIALLGKPNDLLAIFTCSQLSAINQQNLLSKAKVLSTTWAEISTPQKQDYINNWVKRVTVGRQDVNVDVSKMALLKTLLPNHIQAGVDDHFSYEHVTSIPVHLKRCGIETKLVIPNGGTPAFAHQSSVVAIQNALAKALDWNQMLITGSVTSMSELARQYNMTQRYIAHLIKLAFLAPDIMVAIKQGKVPLGLSLDRLKKGFPLDWIEQRIVLGFNFQ